MKKEIKNLIKSREQWEKDIKMYKEFLKGETQTFEGRHGAQEYILMANNRLIEINQKIKELEDK
tara:strand:+ start:1348 stop:1539 length:192 start_codon:yes stop_codon:yes gene_type:complete